MSIDKVLYRAKATSQGGREGTSRSDNGVLDVKLTTPKELGGNGATGTNPEQLFAAGYSACFLGALKFVAGQQKVTLPQDLTVTGDVGIGQIPTGFGIEVDLTIHGPGMEQQQLQDPGRQGPHRLPVLECDAQQHRRAPACDDLMV
jgi:osmotically inducible protein OsmC